MRLGNEIFAPAIECDRHLAIEIENNGQTPPVGCIYVSDEVPGTTDGNTMLFLGNSVIETAVIKLPRNEDNPYTTMGVTFHEILHCLGIEDSDDKESVRCCDTSTRPQCLSEKDVEEVLKMYNLFNEKQSI